MSGRHVESISGVWVDEDEIDKVADCALQKILSMLPEEARTADIVKYVLERAKRKTDGARVTFTKSEDKSPEEFRK